MKKRTDSLPFFIFLMGIILMSCPLPITERVVSSAEDSIKPIILVTNPANRATYHSKIVFTGQLVDDSIKEGDNKGYVSHFAFSASNLSQYRGGISISAEGTVTQDKTLGDILIAYDAETGDFQFEIDTKDFGQGTMEVFLNAKDHNNNESGISIVLTPSEGPVASFQSPSKLTYFPGATLTLEVFIADSAGKLDSVEEIKQISLYCPTLNIVEPVVLDIIGGIYSKPIPFLNQILIFNKEKQILETDDPIIILNSVEDPIQLQVDVEDLNGNIRSIQKTLTNSDKAPTVNILSPVRDSYFSTHSTANTLPVNAELFITKEFQDNGKFIQYINIIMWNRKTDSRKNIRVYDYSSPAAGIFDPNTNVLTTELDVDESLVGGNMTLTVLVTDSSNKQAEDSVSLLEDSLPPLIEVTSFSSASSNTYLSSAEDVTLTFNVIDVGSGLTDPPQITASLGTNPPESLTGNTGTWTITQNIDGIGPGSTDSRIPFEIIVEDQIGNRQEFRESDLDITVNAPLFFYEGSPELKSLTISSMTSSPDNLGKFDDTVTATVILDEGRKLDHTASSITFVSYDANGLEDKVWVSGPMDEDGNVSFDLNSSEMEGTVYYRLNLQDMAGNQLIDAVAKPSEFIADFTAPVITVQNFTTDNPVNPLLASSPNTEFTLEFQVSESNPSDIPPEVTILSTNNAAFSPEPEDMGNGSWKAVFSVGSLSDGKIGYSITTVDNAGNTSAPKEMTLASSDRRIDTSPPEIMVNSFTTDNPNNAMMIASSNDTATLKFTVTETDLSTTPEVSITDAAGTLSLSAPPIENPPNSGVWEAAFMVPVSASDGGIGYTIEVTDAAGNDALPVVLIPGNSPVIVDRTKPVITVASDAFKINDSNSEVWAKENDRISLVFTVEEANLGAEPAVELVTSGGAVHSMPVTILSDRNNKTKWNATLSVESTFEDNNFGYQVNVEDEAGNNADQVELLPANSSLAIDITEPKILVSSFSSNNALNAPGAVNQIATAGDTISLQFSVTENNRGTNEPEVAFASEGGSIASLLVLGMEDPLNSGQWNYSFRVGTSDTGQTGYSITFEDEAGNSTEEEQIVSTSLLIIDNAPPKMDITSFQINGDDSITKAKAGDQVTLAFTITEDHPGTNPPQVEFPISPAGSIPSRDISVSEDPLNPGNWEAGFTVQSSHPNGFIGYKITAEDILGLTEEKMQGGASSSLTIDTTPPTLSFGTRTEQETVVQNGLVDSGETITLTFTMYSEGSEITDVSGEPAPVVTWQGLGDIPSDWTVTYGGNSWEAVYTAPSIPLVTDFSVYQYSITMEDDIGNVATELE